MSLPTSSKRYQLYISADLYNKLMFQKTMLNPIYPYRRVRIRSYYSAEGKMLETSLEQMQAIKKEEVKSDVFTLTPDEEIQFLARFNLCRDFVAAYESIKGNEHV